MYSDVFSSDQYYASAFFLNEQGAKYFTKKLVNQLIKDNIILKQ